MKETKKEIMRGIEADRSTLLENNTVEYWQGEDRIIRLHHTDIIRFKDNGDIILNSGGYQTVTTKDRMNKYCPYQINQDNSIWYVSVNGDRYGFKDNMVIHPNGRVYGAEKAKDLKVLNRKIKQYVDNYITALFNDELDLPGPGDCWYCFFRTEDDETLGKTTKNNEHLIHHMKDSYFVPSLLVRAVERFPVSQVAMHFIGYYFKYHRDYMSLGKDIARDQIKSSLKRYIRSQLGLAS